MIYGWPSRIERNSKSNDLLPSGHKFHLTSGISCRTNWYRPCFPLRKGGDSSACQSDPFVRRRRVATREWSSADRSHTVA